MKNVRVFAKLLLGLVLVSGVSTVPMVVALVTANEAGEIADAQTRENEEIGWAHDLSQRLLRHQLIQGSQFPVDADVQRAAALALAEVLQQLDRIPERDESDLEEESAEIDELRKIINGYSRAFDELARTPAADLAGKQELVAAFAAQKADAARRVEAWIADSMADVAETRDEALGNIARTIAIVLALLVVCVSTSVGVCYLIARGIARPLHRLRDAADRVSKGDFDVELDTARRDEIGELGAAIDRMVIAVRFYAAEAAAKSAKQTGEVDA